jgi:hypothetical protein
MQGDLACAKQKSDSAAGGEKGLEKGTGFAGEDARGDLNLMVELGAGEEFEAGAEGAAFVVVGCVDQARDAGLDDGAGAHGAGFKGYVQSGFGQSVVTEFLCGFAQDYDFGVGGWIAVADGAIAAASEDLPAIDKHGADGNFARFGAGAGFLQRDLHEFGIVHRCVIENITLVDRLNGLMGFFGSTRGKIP